MINTGYHVYPAEIEEVIGRVPGVAAVRVVGEPGGDGRDVVVALVVLAPGAARDRLPEAVSAAVRAALARYKLPRAVRVVDALPVA